MTNANDRPSIAAAHDWLVYLIAILVTAASRFGIWPC